jgi:hypothetical protein
MFLAVVWGCWTLLIVMPSRGRESLWRVSREDANSPLTDFFVDGHFTFAKLLRNSNLPGSRKKISYYLLECRGRCWFSNETRSLPNPKIYDIWYKMVLQNISKFLIISLNFRETACKWKLRDNSTLCAFRIPSSTISHIHICYFASRTQKDAKLFYLFLILQCILVTHFLGISWLLKGFFIKSVRGKSQRIRSLFLNQIKNYQNVEAFGD